MKKLGLVVLAVVVVWFINDRVQAGPFDLPRSSGGWTPTATSALNMAGYGVTSAAGISTSGACASMVSGDVCCWDNNGVQCGWPTTDALADDLRIYGHSASPIGAGANLVGQDIILAPGQGSMTLVATQANCGAGDTVSVTIDGTTTTCTRSATNDDDDEFTCGASDAAMATNIAACLNQATGVDACAGAGCTLFTGVAGTAYIYRASDEPGGGQLSVASSGNHAVAANGVDGAMVVIGAIAQRVNTIAADDTTPSVSGGGYFVTSANSGATAITDLDDPTVDATYVICGGSNTNSSTIADAGNFNLSSALTLALDICVILKVQADNDYVELARNSFGGGWVGTATSALDMATYAINFGTDPADTGDINLENATSVCWEAAPAGTDMCMSVNSDETYTLSGTSAVLLVGSATGGTIQFGGNVNAITCVDLLCTITDNNLALSNGDTADAGQLRLLNAGTVAWEASPAGTDVTLSVNSTEHIVGANNFGLIMPIEQRDQSGFTCTINEWFLDSGGGTYELCFCRAANDPQCAPLQSGVLD